jgi:1-acyl-sn-glycerol-3-phosphate acyltransferase
MIIMTVLKLALLAALAFFCVRLVYWYKEGRKLQNSGYMPPSSTRFARGFYKNACRLITFLGVGPVKIIGAENARFAGRALVLPNHQFALDFAVVGKALPFSFRQVAKAGEVKSAVMGTLAAWIGTVGVQVEGGKSQKSGGGQAVIDAGAKILANSSGARMLLFPQGKLVFDNKLVGDDFRTGATRILNATVATVGADGLYALPMAIHYSRDQRDATRLHRFLNAIGLKSFRRYKDFELVANADGSKTKVRRVYTTYGATVVIGKPIAMKDLPSDPRAAINVIAAEIQKLLTTAENA